MGLSLVTRFQSKESNELLELLYFPDYLCCHLLSKGYGALFFFDTKFDYHDYAIFLDSPTGEYHGNNPQMSKLLHKAVRQKSESAYAVYQQHLANRPVSVSSSDLK